MDQFLNMELPTRADMEEIEISSRLYQEDGGLFMTALVLSNTDSERPGADAVTFVLAHEQADHAALYRPAAVPHLLRALRPRHWCRWANRKWY